MNRGFDPMLSQLSVMPAHNSDNELERYIPILNEIMFLNLNDHDENEDEGAQYAIDLLGGLRDGERARGQLWRANLYECMREWIANPINTYVNDSDQSSIFTKAFKHCVNADYLRRHPGVTIRHFTEEEQWGQVPPNVIRPIDVTDVLQVQIQMQRMEQINENESEGENNNRSTVVNND